MTQDKNNEEPGKDLPEFLQGDANDETEIIERVHDEEPAPEPPAVAPITPEEPVAPSQHPSPKPKRGKKIGLISAGVFLLLAGAYVGGAYYFADRVPADTQVAGVDISHLSEQEAITALKEELAQVTSADLELSLGEARSELSPEDAGLSFDYEATVSQLVGFSLDPRDLIDHLFGKGEQEPVITSEADTLRQALTALAQDFNIDPVEGEISLVEGKVERVEPEDGLGVDIDAAMTRVVDQWIGGPRPIELPGKVVEPNVGEAELQAVEDDVIAPLLSGDVELTVNDETVSIPQETLAESAELVRGESAYTLEFDVEKLSADVMEMLPGLGESPKNARFTFEGGKPVIVPSQNGTGIKPETLAKEVSAAAVKTGEDRSVTLELETTEPEFTTKDAEELGVKERVSHFSTPVPYDPVRTKNLVTGSKKLNGMLIKPGETFSLIDAFGPITEANGYVASGVVINGFEDTAMGGGLSQISTTAFNAAFEAGMEDVTHQPHSRYFSRYPEGREATLFTPHLDMKWRNNTPYGVVIQAWIDDEAHVALWSTKYWETKITTGPRTNITSPKKVYNPSPGCTPERGGASGFTVSVQRVVSKDGKRNDEYSRSYTHTYQPWNNVVCGEKP